MKARLGCQNVRSVRWAVKKAFAQIEVMYDKSRVIVVMSKSSFLPEEQKRRISRGYCRDHRLSTMYWVGGPRTSSSLRTVNFDMEVSINE